MRVVVAVDAPRGGRLAAELGDEGVSIRAVLAPSDIAAAGGALLADADVLVLQVDRASLTPAVVADCDARGVRIAPLGDDEATRRLVAHYGLPAALPLEVEGWVLAESLVAAPVLASRARRVTAGGRVIAVWGPHGAPGRSTVAIELAAELARGGGHVALVDADAHAPSLALSLGLADEGPGFPAACRQAELGTLDDAELTRISAPLRVAGGGIDVLTGINRPGRWPELSGTRVASALAACRSWADTVVVDVAASLEHDEEIVSDLDGPRRNAATLAALRSADAVVAVLSGEPVGVSRFLRAHADLRATIGATPVTVVANRLRPGTLGLDARGQVRRALERFAGIGEVFFVPLDARAVDAAVLAARPVTDVAARSPLAASIRRLVGESVEPAPRAAASLRRRRPRIAAAGAI